MKAKNQRQFKQLRGADGRFIKHTVKPPQKRDRNGRFVKVNQLGFIKKNPARLRDEKGRFINKASAQRTYRDKRGRFTTAPRPWHRRRAVLALPVALGVAGSIFFGTQLYKPITIEEPVAAQEAETTTTEPDYSNVTVVLPKSEPTRLRIAKIAVDTSFVTITKKADETIQVPSDPFAAGWYDKGPTPGEMGPAIVVGHVDRPGGTAVFWRLRELVPGDTFEIDRADGSTVKFKVDQVKQLEQDNFPTEEVYGNLDYAGIRLITCGGTFNRNTRHYSHNTVVYGSLITQDQTVGSSAP